MDIRQLKLELINRISRCEDEAILQAVANVLAMEKGTGKQPVRPDVLPFSTSTETGNPLEQDATDLQGDIDEVFG